MNITGNISKFCRFFQDVILRLSLGARGVINPVCATMGGIVGQEVLKACSGKFRYILFIVGKTVCATQF